MSTSCQTDLSGDDVIQLMNSQEEVAKLKQVVWAMQDNFSKQALTHEEVKKDNHLLKFYTGKYEVVHAYIYMHCIQPCTNHHCWQIILRNT